MNLRSRPPRAATLLLPLAVACGTALTQADRDAFEAQGRARFPDRTHLVGFGEGPTRVEAEERARARVAAQVQSQIEETLRAYEREAVAAGRSEALRDVRRILVSRVETGLGAFIQPREVREVGGTWQATAAADRAALDRALEVEADRRARDAEPLWRRIAGARSWLEAGPAWCEAAAAASELDALHVQRLAVSGKPVWSPERLSLWRPANDRRAAARAEFVIQVTAAAAGTVQDPSPELVRRLQEAGWRASLGAAQACGAEGLAIEVKLDRSCRRSSLGLELCKAAVRLEGRPCGAERALFEERSADAQATHSSDEEAAFRRAAGSIEVKPTVDRVLARVLAAVGQGCSAGAVSTQ